MLLIYASFFIIWIAIEIWFYKTHKRPLNEDEIDLLSKKRTKKYVRKNYVFKNIKISVDKIFKSSMKASGKMYPINETVIKFPSLVSVLLKGKKHEWVVLGIEREGIVKYIWLNKGHDNQSVSLSCNLDEIIDFCKKNKFYSILRFHNHPNSNPQKQNCLLASKQDKISAKYMAEQITQSGVNYFDFVCERGNWILFFRKISLFFCPSLMIWVSPNGFPMTIILLPVSISKTEDRFAFGRSLPSTLINAKSISGYSATTCPLYIGPWSNVTNIESALSTTW